MRPSPRPPRSSPSSPAATTGWFARGASAATPSGFNAITADALDAYRLYVVEVRHPVEVPGSERAHMTQWLSKRFGTALQVPDLESIGLKLVGGRLLPGPAGEAAAFYMYESASGERFTIYCAKATTPESALRYKSEERSAAFYWVDDKVAYVVSGPADRDRLEKVTKTVYEQVDKSGARKSDFIRTRAATAASRAGVRSGSAHGSSARRAGLRP